MSSSPEPWESFTHDPRLPGAAALRAADQDRAVVQDVLAEAYADGRLSKDEYDDRSVAATKAKMLGELPPIMADLVPITATTGLVSAGDLDAQALQRWRKARADSVQGLLFIAVVTTVIWLAGGAHFFWPLFPILFVGMRVPQVLFNKREIVAKERARLERKQRKQLGGGSQP